MRISWTHASRRHGIARRDARYVVVHCGLVFLQPAPAGSPVPEDRFVYLGDDPSGRALEVIGVELETGDQEHLRVIHVMELRAKYHHQYEEDKQWRV